LEKVTTILRIYITSLSFSKELLVEDCIIKMKNTNTKRNLILSSKENIFKKPYFKEKATMGLLNADRTSAYITGLYLDVSCIETPRRHREDQQEKTPF